MRLSENPSAVHSFSMASMARAFRVWGVEAVAQDCRLRPLFKGILLKQTFSRDNGFGAEPLERPQGAWCAREVKVRTLFDADVR